MNLPYATTPDLEELTVNTSPTAGHPRLRPVHPTSANRLGRWARISLMLVSLGIVTLAESGAASAGAHGVGAGSNQPNVNNWTPTWSFSCTDRGYFRVEGASINMWSNGGNRVKGFQFKYRVVPQGTALAPFSNWSSNVHTSFHQGAVRNIRMDAGPQGQAWDPGQAWALQIKLKYPRSLRTAWRFKYKKAIASPDCGGTDSSGIIDGLSGGARSAR